jgi:hypothetical protein
MIPGVDAREGGSKKGMVTKKEFKQGKTNIFHILLSLK